jgi:tetratricopeptide (TPR) repeat protein
MEEAEWTEEEQELLRVLDPLMGNVRVSPDFLSGVLVKAGLTLTEDRLEEEGESEGAPPAEIISLADARQRRNWWKITSYAQAAVIVLAFAFAWIGIQSDVSWKRELTRSGDGKATQLLTQADQYAQEGKYEPAVEAYEAYVRMEEIAGKPVGAVLRKLAAVHYRFGRYAQAYEAASAAVLLTPLDACAYWYRGAAAYALGNTAQALQNWRQAKALGDSEAQQTIENLQQGEVQPGMSRQQPCEHF